MIKEMGFCRGIENFQAPDRKETWRTTTDFVGLCAARHIDGY
jgi:hypothetical protein